MIFKTVSSDGLPVKKMPTSHTIFLFFLKNNNNLHLHMSYLFKVRNWERNSKWETTTGLEYTNQINWHNKRAPETWQEPLLSENLTMNDLCWLRDNPSEIGHKINASSPPHSQHVLSSRENGFQLETQHLCFPPDLIISLLGHI